mmetsp:Transcript_7092/g.17727  ORF Transcript_7092/g.17727 Transcript_7092/m.17727 type:complete len:213 (-) Transcript_7092:385-1023(-)
MIRRTIASREMGCVSCSSCSRPSSTALPYRSGTGSPAGSSGERTTVEMFIVRRRSAEMRGGAPRITSSTQLSESSESARSCSDMIGWCGPRLLAVLSSCTPTKRKSPLRRASKSACTWPMWRMSNSPSMYTTRSAAVGVRPEENWRRRHVVGRNCETPLLEMLAPTYAAASDAAARGCGLRVRSSSRPTMSVVLTPSVRLTILIRPAAFASA